MGEAACSASFNLTYSCFVFLKHNINILLFLILALLQLHKDVLQCPLVLAAGPRVSSGLPIEDYIKSGLQGDIIVKSVDESNVASSDDDSFADASEIVCCHR